MAHNSSDDTRRGYAAIFIDFENIYYFLKDQYADLPDLNDYLFDLLRNLDEHLERRLSLVPIIRKAYADFERLGTAPQGTLYLMGIDTHNVLGTHHKNAADMRLSIDAMETLYTRPEIEAFVFVAGDRDYIPIIQHLKRQARTVKAVAFRGNLSGDLLQNVGEEHFIEATELLGEEAIERLRRTANRAREVARERDAEREPKEPPAAAVTPASEAPPVSRPSTGGLRSSEKRRKTLRPVEPEFLPIQSIRRDDALRALDLMLTGYGQHHEIWLSPFLRKLSEDLPHLAEYERKMLLNDLEAAGAIRVEKRKGEPFDYSVILVNYNHPSVRERWVG